MTKKDWIDVIRTIQDQPDVMDYISFGMAILSTVAIIATGYFTLMAARASREAVKITVKIFNNEKSEKELMLMPILEFQKVVFSNETKFNLVNINELYPVSFTSFGFAIGHNSFATERETSNLVKVNLKYHMEQDETLLVTVNFTALNHKNYKASLKIRRDYTGLFIDDYDIILMEK